jgi:hypothetical protein
MSEERNAPEWHTFEGPTVRDRLMHGLRADLLGPEDANETLGQSPNTRYLVGMLAPAGTPIDVTEDEQLETMAGDEQSDAAATAYTSLDPSAIGLSFVVEADCANVSVIATWGEYARLDDDDAEDVTPGDEDRLPENDMTTSGGDDQAAGDDQPLRPRWKPTKWRRTPHEFVLRVPTAVTEKAQSKPAGDGVSLTWHARPLGDAVVISIFLANDRPAPGDRRAPDDQWLYQPKISARTDEPRILGRQIQRTTADPDPDVASADLLYRSFHEYATGHGVSVNWHESPSGARADAVWTDVLPDREVPVVTHAEISGVAPPDMDELAAADATSVGPLLEPLLTAYEKWIRDRRDKDLPKIAAPDDAVAVDHLVLAEASLARMRAGLEVLKSDEDVLKAFAFANRAMALQLRHAVRVRALRRGEDPPAEQAIAASWRPFQIGFILQCLPGLADPDHDDRRVADLLWFPTGGGKTEAYLGLTAFTIALRRLRPATRDVEGGAGIAVLMRYTLRLLTTQQFQRAVTMICACELARSDDSGTWGAHSFSIGLWVGRQATPNTFEESEKALKDLKDGRRVYEANPYQVVYCPWCGHDVTPQDYVADRDLERTLVKCRNPECDFAASKSRLGLPLIVVDEEIYRNPPSLLLATVDKFAGMPWSGRVQALFGRVARDCPRHGFLTAAESHAASHRETKGHPMATVTEVLAPLAPPELVIQDELHLISGPLGTLVGIYEVAVQELCRTGHQSVNGPKVIASTATIRRAGRQVEALFGRDVDVFPPLGFEASDSFFARQADPADNPGRVYLGVYAPGRSVKTALVRVYAALLSRAKVEFDAEPSETSDSYMTLVGYFNSLRELGGAVRLVEDDVPARLNVLRRRGFGPRRPIFEKQELTSRITSGEIPERLKQLERQFFNPASGQYPIDVLLASNMLSVGVDIDRLGLMVVSGQPKTTAEYIQATSRVGRSHPGLVVEVYNWIRPRDTSHYERFRHYHDTFYRHVEATSVTPFSARARDRALPAVLTSFVRLDTRDLVRESDAAAFTAGNESAERISAALIRRAEKATQRDDVRQDTEQQLANLRAEWSDDAADSDHPLVYTRSGIGKDKTRVNLLKPMEQRNRAGVWEAARSLREVEGEVDVVLKDTPGGT